ncbi:hypothetical protein IQ07DRAFT_589813 [Pyrenochaeta sp. DS3sAY3a]|nr:hypothetical protein IQ07DRAFT_589813 [Pyrenochaeta sp. DS3sAY3a]
MRLLLALLAAALAVSASPFAWAEPQASIAPSPSGLPSSNGSRKGNRTRKNPHREPTPTFKLQCDCVKPIVPMNLLSENEKCLMNHAAAMGCYLGSTGGCPSPAPACGLGVL